MVRRSGRHSNVQESASAPSKKVAPHKRAASQTEIKANGSKKAKKLQATPTKSQYFHSDDDKSADYGEDQQSIEQPTTDDDPDESDFADESVSVASENASASEGEIDDSDDEPTSRKRKGKGNPSPGTLRASESEVWRSGVKTGLGPGREVIIKRPKARPAGKTPYEDATIHPNTLLFLDELKDNNNREWLKMHDADFRASEKDWYSFVEKLTEKLIEVDDSIPELPVKDVIFRIYRDVRFSKDPTPYKPYFSVAWSRAGRKSPYAHYYLQIGADKSYIGGGIWHPDADPLAALRRAIDRAPKRFKEVLRDQGIRREFLENVGKTDAQVVKAFVKTNSENALKTKPKGFNGDHPDIDLLRLRNYVVGRKLSTDEVLGTAGMERITSLLACLKPMITYLNSVVMPDEQEESESEAGSDDDGEDEPESENSE